MTNLLKKSTIIGMIGIAFVSMIAMIGSMQPANAAKYGYSLIMRPKNVKIPVLTPVLQTKQKGRIILARLNVMDRLQVKYRKGGKYKTVADAAAVGIKIFSKDKATAKITREHMITGSKKLIVSKSVENMPRLHSIKQSKKTWTYFIVKQHDFGYTLPNYNPLYAYRLHFNRKTKLFM